MADSLKVFILTAGHCGSRVVVEAFENLGYPAPGIGDDDRKNHRRLGLIPSHFDKEKINYDKLLKKAQAHTPGRGVFKAAPLMWFWRDLEGQLVGVYRHPAMWRQAVVEKAKSHTWAGWKRFHAELLEAVEEKGFPLIDFSRDFVEDMTRNFGNCMSHYDSSRVHQVEPKIEVPEDVMNLYEELNAKRIEQRGTSDTQPIPASSH